MPISPQTPDSSRARVSSHGNRSTTRLPSIPDARPNALPRGLSRDIGSPLHVGSPTPWTAKPHTKEGSSNWLGGKNAASQRIQAKFSGSTSDASVMKSRPQTFVPNDGAADWMTDRFIKAEKGISRVLLNNAVSELKPAGSGSHVTAFPEEVVILRDLAANRVVNELRDRLSPDRYSVPDREVPIATPTTRDVEKTQSKKKKKKKRK